MFHKNKDHAAPPSNDNNFSRSILISLFSQSYIYILYTCKIHLFPDSSSEIGDLGIGSGHVSFNQFSQLLTQTTSIKKSFLPIQAKLFSNTIATYDFDSGWMSTFTAGLWYQVDLYILHEIHRMITQGSASHDDRVKSFSLGLSNDSFSWTMVQKSNVDVVS